MPIEYQPNFQHQEWVDNQDRVMAGGANGFNVRFNAIEAEFQTLSQLFVQVSEALAALGQAPSATPTVVTFTPRLIAASNPAYAGWRVGPPGMMEKPPGATMVWGYMPVELIDGVTIQSFRVTGRNSGPGKLLILLQRQDVVGPAMTTIVKLENVAGDPFDVTGAAGSPSSLTTVNNEFFKYNITAEMPDVQSNHDTETVRLTAFQIRFLKP